MSKLSEIFSNIDDKIAKTNSSFSGWNDANAIPSKEKVNDYEKASAALKTKARDFVAAMREMETIQGEVEKFCREANSLCER